MKRHSRLPLIVAAALSFSVICGLSQEWRTVENTKGQKLKIIIESISDGKVTFKTRDGKEHTLALTKLSKADQEALADWKPSRSKTIKDDSKVMMAVGNDRQTIFRTKHFEMEIIGSAKAEEMRVFAPALEATYWAFEQLPLKLMPKPKDQHFKLKIYLKEDEFNIASGETLAEGQVAVYNLAEDIIKAPLGRLKPSPALIGEVAFALLGKRLNQLPPWLAVAISEYLAAAPFKNGQLDLTDPLSNIQSYLAKTYGLSDKDVPILAPEAVLRADYSTFRSDQLDGAKSRSSALVLFHFLAFIDGDGDASNFKSYFTAIRTNTPLDEANKVLMATRTEEAFKDDLN